MKKSVRAHAAEIIDALQNQQSNLDALLRKHSKNLSPTDKKLLQSICYGICREWFHLEEIESHLLDKPLKARDQILSAIVRCGVYELGWMGSKEHAVVSEYVDVTLTAGRPWARGLINAVLRQFIRKKSELKMERRSSQTLWNHPAWLIETIQTSWPDYWEQILVENNVHPPMTLRVNRKKEHRDTYIKALASQGVKAEAGSSPDSVRLIEPMPVQVLAGFAEGVVSVQDESSQWASIILNPQKGERILDACAAPGGKTCHLLEMADTHITALDVSEQRLSRIKENLVRLGLRADLIAADASHTDSWWDQTPFDAVLLDLPCSATGVIRRNPDVRLMRSEASLKSLIGMQTMILDATWETLRVGGRFLVTTCSILPQENQQQIRKFLDRHSDAELIQIDGVPGIDTGFGIQHFPIHTGGDGFFYALLVKSEPTNDGVSA